MAHGGGGDNVTRNTISSPSSASASSIESTIRGQTSTVKVNDASSPSASVAVSVWPTAAVIAAGVPETMRARGSNVRPSGKAGVRR